MALWSNDMGYLTYCHTRNDTNQIFYIGKGNEKRAYDSYNRNLFWKRIANKYGHKVCILAHWKTEQEALDHEKLLISCFKDMGYQLANMSDGGEGGATGVKRSDEFKAKVSERMKGKPKSEQTKRRISECKTGKPNPKLAGDLNPSKNAETRLKKSISMKKFYANGGTNPMQGRKRPDLALRNKLRANQKVVE